MAAMSPFRSSAGPAPASPRAQLRAAPSPAPGRRTRRAGAAVGSARAPPPRDARRAPGTASSRGPPQRLAHPLLGRQLRIRLCQDALGVGHGVAELDERVAGNEVWRVATGRGRSLDRAAELLLQLEHDALRGLLADAGDRLEALRVL